MRLGAFLLPFFVLAVALRLATTTSVYDSGLLDQLLPPFQKATGIQVEVLAVGTGQALTLAARGDVDAVLVHAPDLEAEAVRQGHLAEGFCLAQNRFLLVGPPEDPARVREAPTVLEALRQIAKTQAPFVSRGDRSGTHVKELALWKEAGVTPTPPGTWSRGRAWARPWSWRRKKEPTPSPIWPPTSPWGKRGAWLPFTNGATLYLSTSTAIMWPSRGKTLRRPGGFGPSWPPRRRPGSPQA
ncbi:substrate-binding domain-containing protein [Thermus brockianus]|uniref:substrate-binding domain-containing protein n=1 Tax=Thermus brockianus TaxID=56956 RepID=UPI000A4D4957|nr:substrate-binding domain-containing protein [Thermus brockianus]